VTHFLVTGAAGVIGFHLARLLLEEGAFVHGYDGMTDYYDVGLKRQRNAILGRYQNYSFTEGMLEDSQLMGTVTDSFKPDVIVHLAAQAGVRYSLENPRAYIEGNVIGTFNVMEAAKAHSVRHLLMASTSSVYGANDETPFSEIDKADTQLTIYAATKKANESMAHSYAHLWDLPTTMFRFFTVYGPWGRPDLAYYKFVDAILDGRPIDVYNNGDMYRDFTHVGDLVRGIRLLVDAEPCRPDDPDDIPEYDSLSPVAPFRVVNIGNSEKVKLLDFIDAIEDALGIQAIRNYMPMQPGDVHATWADTRLLRELTGFEPDTNFRDGVRDFVDWYRDHRRRQ
jgi:UDP-glucuronate 4-epimerase